MGDRKTDEGVISLRPERQTEDYPMAGGPR